MATWLAIRKPVTGLRGTVLKFAAFLIPLGIWCAVSYCPFIWHPLVNITDAGDSGLAIGIPCDPKVLRDINQPLIAEGKRPAFGVPANPRYLPEPHRVAKALYTAFTTEPQYKSEEWFHASILQSLQTIFWGFAAAMTLAIPIGILCGTFDVTAKLTEPFIDFVRYMPPPSFAALMMAIWGVSDAPKIAIIFIGCFFNMILVTANTTRSLDVSLLEAAQTLGARRLSLITHVILPGVLPGIYKDVRICLGTAWTFLTAAELVGQMSGLTGAFINQQQKHQNYDNVYAGLIVIGMLGFAIDQVLAFVGTLIFPWTPEANHKARRWFRFLGFLTRPVEGSRPGPLRPEEMERFTRPRDSSAPYSTQGVATPQVVAEAPPESPARSHGEEVAHAGR
jgi:NitT/TauT family transport system permease protein